MRNQCYPEMKQLTIGSRSLLYSDHMIGTTSRMLPLTPTEYALWEALLQDFHQAFHTPDGLIIGYRKGTVLRHLTQSSHQALRRHMSRLSNKLSVFGLRLRWCDEGYLLMAEAHADQKYTMSSYQPALRSPVQKSE